MRDSETEEGQVINEELTFKEWKEKYIGDAKKSRISEEKGITNKREIGDPVRRIDREYIRSRAFGEKFEKLDNPSEVNRQLKKCARKALFNNDGKMNEDIRENRWI